MPKYKMAICTFPDISVVGILTETDKRNLKYLVDKFNEWYGNISGVEDREDQHMAEFRSIQRTMRKLGIKVEFKGD